MIISKRIGKTYNHCCSASLASATAALLFVVVAMAVEGAARGTGAGCEVR